MRLCSEAGCASVAVSRGPLPTHAREADRRHHHGEHRKLYNRKRWAMARRKQIVESRSASAAAGSPPTSTTASTSEMAVTRTSENLASLCHECHAKVGRERQMVARDRR